METYVLDLVSDGVELMDTETTPWYLSIPQSSFLTTAGHHLANICLVEQHQPGELSSVTLWQSIS